jgi:hypothetical protein
VFATSLLISNLVVEVNSCSVVVVVSVSTLTVVSVRVVCVCMRFLFSLEYVFNVRDIGTFVPLECLFNNKQVCDVDRGDLAFGVWDSAVEWECWEDGAVSGDPVAIEKCGHPRQDRRARCDECWPTRVFSDEVNK